jgi:hypothetical protein
MINQYFVAWLGLAGNQRLEQWWTMAPPECADRSHILNDLIKVHSLNV